jgi:hypothetical protein
LWVIREPERKRTRCERHTAHDFDSPKQSDGDFVHNPDPDDIITIAHSDK